MMAGRWGGGGGNVHVGILLKRTPVPGRECRGKHLDCFDTITSHVGPVAISLPAQDTSACHAPRGKSPIACTREPEVPPGLQIRA